MIDSAFNCWLIEVNCSPAMSHSTKVTAQLVKECMNDMCKVLFDYPNSPKTNTGSFELIHRAPEGKVMVPLSHSTLQLVVKGHKLRHPNMV